LLPCAGTAGNGKYPQFPLFPLQESSPIPTPGMPLASSMVSQHLPNSFITRRHFCNFYLPGWMSSRYKRPSPLPHRLQSSRSPGTPLVRFPSGGNPQGHEMPGPARVSVALPQFATSPRHHLRCHLLMGGLKESVSIPARRAQGQREGCSREIWK